MGKIANDKLKAAVILGFFLGFAGMITNNSLFHDTVSTWTMRDEMIFFGIISASMQLQVLKRKLLRNYPFIIQLILIIQITQLLTYTSYLLYFAKGDSYFYKKTRTNAFNFFQPLANGDELFDWFTKSKSLYGDRVLLSPLIEKDLGSESNKLAKENLYSIPDINIYTELNIVNDVNLKGISMDRIYSSSTYTKGSINSNYDVIRNTALLDIAGINWVLIKKTELEENRPFSNLLEKDNFTFSWKDEVWVLLHNPDAWPKAFVMSAGVLNLTSAYRENCGHSGILCAHMEQYLPFKRNIKVRKVGADGHVQLSIPSQSENIVLGLSTMYRPEWEALANGEKLIVRPLFDAFIGVEVPSGISNITLDFNPKVRIWLNYLSLSAFVLCFAGIVVLISREKRQNKFLIKQ